MEPVTETAPSSAPPRPRWHPVARSLLFVFGFLLIQTAIGAAAYGVVEASGIEGGLSTGWMLALFVLSGLPLLALTVLFLRVLDRRDLASLGVRWPDGGGPRRALRQAGSVPLAVLALVGVWMLLIEALPQSDVEVAGLSPEAGFSLSLLLLGFLLQGGIEEWIFRGYIYRALKERWRWWVAALVSSAGFGLMHAGNPNVTIAAVANTVLAGFLLCLLVERSGSLWSATLAHGVWNFAIACLASLPVSGVQISHLLRTAVTGPPEITGGGFGPEGSLVLTALALPLLIFLWPRRSQLDVSSREDPSMRQDSDAGL